MKSGIALLTVLFMNVSLADCTSIMEEASSRGNLGSVASTAAVNQLAKVQDLIQTNATLKEVCGAGQEAKRIADIAANELNITRDLYLEAAQVCKEANDEMVALYYANLSVEISKINAGVITKTNKVLSSSQCKY